MTSLSRSSIVVLAFATIFALIVILQARKNRTSERHTIAWLLVCTLIAALAIWRSAIESLASYMGIFYAPSALFSVCLGSLMWLVFRLSIEVSHQKDQIRKLAQDLALSRVQAPVTLAPAATPEP